MNLTRAEGPIIAEVTSGFAQPGAYTLLLWEANANQILMEERGNFINSDDDAYPLPTPNNLNDGRIVESIVTVAITPPIKEYNVSLKIFQNDVELGSESRSGTSNSVTETIDLFIQLKKG